MSFLALLAAVVVTLLVQRPLGLSRRGRALWIGAAIVGPSIVASGLAALWYFHRPQPGPAREWLFRGVLFEQEVRTTPRPIVAHVVTIDLRDPGISFLVTPLDPSWGGVIRAQTTSQFLVRHGAQLAINGDFFLPWWSDGPTDFYPHEGEPTDVLGAAVSGKDAYGYRVTPYSALVIGRRNAASIVEVKDPFEALPPAEMVLSGKQIIVDGGAITPACTTPGQAKATHPRIAAALDRAGDHLILFVIDGRQPGYSEGATLEDLARIVIDHGGFRAVNLDGGGSSTLVIEDGRGGATPLNMPFHTRIPMRQRPVPNHLGVFAAPLGAE